MKCCKHRERDGVVLCNECGQALCQECADKFHPPLCSRCASARAREIKGQLVKSISLSVLLMLVGIFVIKSPAGILLAGIPYGWAILNAITPSMFLWLSWVGWIIYFLIKLLLAYFIGLIALPIKLIKWIIELSSINHTLKNI